MATLNREDTLVHKFYNQAMENSESIAIHVRGDAIKYGELYAHVHTLAEKILEVDLDCAKCAIFSDRSYFAYLSILATLFSGKTYVPINMNATKYKIEQIFSICTPNIVFVDCKKYADVKDFLQSIPASKVFMVNQDHFISSKSLMPKHDYYLWSSDLQPQQSIDELLNNVEPSSNAYLMFTSGSTGTPKGIQVSHANAVSYIDSMTKLFKPKSSDKFAHLVELTFDLSIHDLFLCWCNGSGLYVMPDNYIFGIRSFINKHDITYWMSVPSTITLLEKIGHLDKNCMPSIKQSFFCGEALSVQQAKAWSNAAPNSLMTNVYGPTEATVAFTYFNFNSESFSNSNQIVPIGKALGVGEVAVVNKLGNKCKVGEVGELCLSGAQVVSGYFNNNEKTSSQFVKFSWDAYKSIWYKTGDLVVDTKELGLEYKGRIDDQWQIRGHRIEKLEVETEIKRVINCQSVAVVPIFDKHSRVIDFDVFIATDLSESEIFKVLVKELADIMLPNQVRIIKDIPKNSNGKTDYNFLKQLIAV